MEQIPRSLRGRISGVERVTAVPGQDNKYKDRSWAGFVTWDVPGAGDVAWVAETGFVTWHVARICDVEQAPGLLQGRICDVDQAPGSFRDRLCDVEQAPRSFRGRICDAE